MLSTTLRFITQFTSSLLSSQRPVKLRFNNTGAKAAPFVGNGLACKNCHIDAGRRAGAAPMWAAWVKYPEFYARDGSITTMPERIRNCFVNSMNAQDSPSGGPPPADSPIYSDLQMYNPTMPRPDPGLFMNQFLSEQASTRENKWSGTNNTRFRNDECDKLWKAAENEMDPAKRAAAFIRMNDVVIANNAVITVVVRNGVSGANVKLRGMDLTAWDSTLWRLAYWHKA